MILRELLRGMEALAPQSVANMTIIPLVGQETAYQQVGSIADIYLNRDPAYNKLEMGNASKLPTIMPNGYSLITKEKAQDRTVANKTILPANKAKMVNAFCVQSSQCGHMEKETKEQRVPRLLPVSIRKMAYAQRNSDQLSALWDKLGQYNAELGVSGNFLASYFEHFKTQLDQFVAEFELEPYQRGVIVLINDEIVGVEVSPNSMVFSAQWELLIRDCYGAEAVAMQKKYIGANSTTLLGDVATIDELAAAVTVIEGKELADAEQTVTTILNQSGSVSVRQIEGNLRVLDVEIDDYVGQAVDSDGQIIDLTLMRKDASFRSFRFKK